VSGKPILQYLLERLKRRHSVALLIVATSDDPSDDPIAEFCARRNTDCYRGSLEDVAGRFRDVVVHYNLDWFIRINGDSPLFDPELVQKVVEIYNRNDVDLVTNTIVRSYPRGQSIEAVSSSCFLKTYSKFELPEDYEHVTRYFYRHAGDLKIWNFESGEDCGDESLAVDTLEDVESLEAIVEAMGRPQWTYGWEELLEIKRKLSAKAEVDG